MKKRYMHYLMSSLVHSPTYHLHTSFLSVSTDRFVRKYFYDMASEAALDATILCSKKQFTNRMKMTVMFPESESLSILLVLSFRSNTHNTLFSSESFDGLISHRYTA